MPSFPPQTHGATGPTGPAGVGIPGPMGPGAAVAAITSGTIDGAAIGSTSPAAASLTNLLVGGLATFNGGSVHKGLSTNSLANVTLTTPGAALNETSGISFKGTFTAGSDLAPRRVADIWGGFSGGNWGQEALIFGVGLGGADENNTRALEVMRLTETAMILAGPTVAINTSNATYVGNQLKITNDGNSHIDSIQGTNNNNILWINGIANATTNIGAGGGKNVFGAGATSFGGSVAFGNNVMSIGSQTTAANCIQNFYNNGTTTADAKIVVNAGTAGTLYTSNINIYAGGLYLAATMYPSAVIYSSFTITTGATQASPFIATAGTRVFVNKTTSAPTYITLPNIGEVTVIDAKGDCSPSNPIVLTIPTGSGSSIYGQGSSKSVSMTNSYETLTMIQNGSGYYAL